MPQEYIIHIYEYIVINLSDLVLYSSSLYTELETIFVLHPHDLFRFQIADD